MTEYTLAQCPGEKYKDKLWPAVWPLLGDIIGLNDPLALPHFALGLRKMLVPATCPGCQVLQMGMNFTFPLVKSDN